MIGSSYRRTLYACYLGYVIQAIVNIFAPLLFLTFQSEFGIPLEQITLLVTVNFTIQLLIDLLSMKIVDKIGYRPCIIVANIFAALGLLGLGTLPDLMPSSYGHSEFCCSLCHRWRAFGGSGKSHCGSLSFYQ